MFLIFKLPTTVSAEPWKISWSTRTGFFNSCWCICYLRFNDRWRVLINLCCILLPRHCLFCVIHHSEISSCSRVNSIYLFCSICGRSIHDIRSCWKSNSTNARIKWWIWISRTRSDIIGKCSAANSRVKRSIGALAAISYHLWLLFLLLFAYFNMSFTSFCAKRFETVMASNLLKLSCTLWVWSCYLRWRLNLWGVCPLWWSLLLWWSHHSWTLVNSCWILLHHEVIACQHRRWEIV